MGDARIGDAEAPREHLDAHRTRPALDELRLGGTKDSGLRLLGGKTLTPWLDFHYLDYYR